MHIHPTTLFYSSFLSSPSPSPYSQSTYTHTHTLPLPLPHSPTHSLLQRFGNQSHLINNKEMYSRIGLDLPIESSHQHDSQ